MADFISLDDAKAEARITTSAEDAVLERKLAQAHEMVIETVKDRVSDADTWSDTVDAWTEATVPASVQAAILAQFVFLARYRGDEAPPPQKGPLCDQAMNYISRLKDPAVA